MKHLNTFKMKKKAAGLSKCSKSQLWKKKMVSQMDNWIQKNSTIDFIHYFKWVNIFECTKLYENQKKCALNSSFEVKFQFYWQKKTHNDNERQ